jgi:hypothetical protein
MNIGTHEANDRDPSYNPSDDGLNRNAISYAINNRDGDKGDDEDDDAVDGPTVEAYVVLAKTACKYYFT